MSSLRIAIATCAGYADLKIDEERLRAELAARGIESEMVIWNQVGDELDSFDACLVRSTWDYHEKHDEFLAWAHRVQEAIPLWNDAETIAWNSDKRYLRELAAGGVQTVPFLPSPQDQGELSLVYIDGRYSHAVRKHPAEGDFRVQSIWRGTFASAEPTPADQEIANRALSQVEPTPLYARVDLVDDPENQPCLIELELIEPNLYLTSYPQAAGALAEAVADRLR